MFEKIIQVSGKEFQITAKYHLPRVEITELSSENGLTELELAIEVTDEMAGRDTCPVTVKWWRHMVGIISFWSPIAERMRRVKQWYNASTNISNFYYGAPVMSIIDQGDQNFSTIAVSEGIEPIRMTFSVNDFEEKEHLDYHLYLFEKGAKEGTYTLRIRIDERQIPYYEAIASVSEWWKQFYPAERERTVSGELPLYSSWYNYHQNPLQESLEKELEEAVTYGFRSLIIDDGWSYDGNGSGDYRDCGNWKVAESKFPDFKGFVQKMHRVGVKVALWFPVPFVGFQTEDYQTFAGRILYDHTGLMAGVLDPRYPEVRDYIVGTYVDMVSKYDLDGLKLDFIDSFRCPDNLPLREDKLDGMDCEEVEEGVVRLLRQIRESLTDQKPDFMIEFRQMYVGPAIARECNMLRAGDCPFDLVTNRVRIVDLRLMNYNLAVHADMLVWSPDETLENCAKMLYNILFGVPQISVLFQRSTQEQKDLIGRYIRYWEENKEVILHGAFKAQNPFGCYSFLSGETNEKRIAVAYEVNSFIFDGKTTDLFNATAGDFIYLENCTEAAAKVWAYDCRGTLVGEYKAEPGVCKITVPGGGMITVI